MVVPQLIFRHVGVVLKLLDRLGSDWTRRLQPQSTERE